MSANYSAELIVRILKRVQEGDVLVDISKETGITTQTIKNWMKKANVKQPTIDWAQIEQLVKSSTN